MTSPINKPHHNFIKCSICGCPLSIIPIYYNSSLGSVCGRCENIREQHNEETFERQIIFEMFMKNFIFPCAFQNQGCIAELNGDTAFIHEQICLFRVTTVLCPLFHEKFCEWCTWIGDYSKLSEHIRNEHKKYFSETLTLTLTPELGNKFLFSEIDSSLVMVLFDNRIQSNNLVCSILSDMSYKQCLENKFEIYFCAREAEQVVFEGEQLEHLSPSTRITPEYNLTIPVSSFEHLFEKCDEIEVLISILPKGRMKTNSRIFGIGLQLQNKVSEASELTTSILHELECPICTELMGPPIYLCTEGHNMCSRCRHKILECPVCRGNILGGRNLTLEKLCSIVTGPCEYRKDGCSYIDSISKVKEHEPFCYLAFRNCIINICEWLGRTLELPEHLDEEHSFRDISTAYSFKLDTKSEQHMFLYEDKIFLLNLSSSEKTLSYSIQCLGGKHIQYDYEIELIDPTIETNKIVLRDTCQPIGYNFNKNSFLLFSIPVEMLDWLLKGGDEIIFKVNIHDISD